ncbi:MAG: four helix bundle protein [Planctomycetes bacterium]|nr:four helix bundle protein [Planctomycetota bacterium]
MKNTDGHGQTRTEDEGLIPRHGGFRNLMTFRLAELIYDVTVRFCEMFINPRSRTFDQMVQAARSGSRNISEGSMDSATSKKMEMKLTGVARGSLEELRLDYRAFLRQRSLPELGPNHPVLQRFKARRCATLDEFRAWVAEEVRLARKNTDAHGQTRTQDAAPEGVRVSPCLSVSLRDLPAMLVANGALSLLNLCIHHLGRQLGAQADAFERHGGFTERLYRRRTARRQEQGERS